MKPQFTDTLAWQQAELLMQPAYIRILDHIRKHLEQSPWIAQARQRQVFKMKKRQIIAKENQAKRLSRRSDSKSV